MEQSIEMREKTGLLISARTMDNCEKGWKGWPNEDGLRKTKSVRTWGWKFRKKEYSGVFLCHHDGHTLQNRWRGAHW
jgi:hypothetical protein